jgi:hypothetical protein
MNADPDSLFTLMRSRTRLPTIMRVRILVKVMRTSDYWSVLSLYASVVNIHGPPWLRFEPLQLLDFDYADPEPAFHSNADPDAACQKKAVTLRASKEHYWSTSYVRHLVTLYIHIFWILDKNREITVKQNICISPHHAFCCLYH